jgi:hypothetical protein
LPLASEITTVQITRTRREYITAKQHADHTFAHTAPTVPKAGDRWDIFQKAGKTAVKATNHYCDEALKIEHD